MGDYYETWKHTGPGIIRRTVSYRSRNKVTKKAISQTQRAIAREESLENSRDLTSKQQLYSDLYAQTDIGETYNHEDTGHEFLTTTFKCRRNEDLPLTPKQDPKRYRYRYNADDPKELICIWPMCVNTIATLGLRHIRPLEYSSRFRNYPGYRLAVNKIQDALWAQCPDSISGSLGQDVVDVLAFGKMLDHLLTLRTQGVSLYKQYLRFSAKKRKAIDTAFARWRASPKQGFKHLAKDSGGAYLSWLFQYLPWVDDLQTLLGAATDSYLLAKGRTRERKIIGLGRAVRQLDKDLKGDYPQVYMFHPEFDGVIDHYRTLDSASKDGYYGLRRTWSGLDSLDDVSYRLTASVVSVWTQNFEHGSVEPLYEINKKLGLAYPSLIWDLIPWSWLVEWFVKVGKFIDRSWMQAYGEWNCAYAYVTTKMAATAMGMTCVQTCRWHVHPSDRLEVSAPVGLSTSQWGILTALGLSRRN